MLLGSNEYYELNLNEETYRIMAGFGGGLHTEELCGALSGGVAVMGVVFSEEKGYEKDKIKAATKTFVESFKRELNSINCKEIKDVYRKDDIKCSPVVEKGAEILERIIKEYH